MKLLKRLAAILGILILISVVAFLILDKPLPQGTQGSEADAKASRIEKAVNLEAWSRTHAVRWTFAGRNKHLWDRQRRLSRVEWSDNKVLLRNESPEGRAYRAGQEVHGTEAQQLIEKAHASFINDSFWLNPVAMFRGDNVLRSLVESDDTGLLITYTSGGLTPGDSYFWITDPSGLPKAWRMWVSIIPVGGVETTWEGWKTLRTGAKISTLHSGPLGFTLELTDVDGAETLSELIDGPDPFAPLFERQ